MFCTLSALAGKHMESALCREGARRNRRKIMNLRCIRAFRRTFQIWDQPIETVTTFRYLGRIITSRDNDWEAARRNLHKAKERWALISRILMRESATPRISALFYKATIQTILLFWIGNMGDQQGDPTITYFVPLQYHPPVNKTIPTPNTWDRWRMDPSKYTGDAAYSWPLHDGGIPTTPKKLSRRLCTTSIHTDWMSTGTPTWNSNKTYILVEPTIIFRQLIRTTA
jgi:hypothetical protein